MMFAASRSHHQVPAAGADTPGPSDSADEMTAVLEVWDAEHKDATFDVKPTLQRYYRTNFLLPCTVVM
jgi:hypothetical protein